MKTKIIKDFIAALAITVLFGACSKFVDTDLPKTDLVAQTVFESDQTALAAISNIYAQMASSGYASGNALSLTFYGGLSADEFDFYSTVERKKQFFDNQILPDNTELETNIWTLAYNHIYKANAILEGLTNASRITPVLRVQLEGEAKFIRAFVYFYLTNCFGDVPLVLTTDYRINGVIPKSPKAVVYQQILKDLKDAQQVLAADYSFSNNERVRPNKFAATALLARTYLYLEDWTNSEIQANLVIDNKTLYDTVGLNSVFLKNSKESIFQLIRDGGNANDAVTFVVTGTRPLNVALKASFVGAFEPLDKRRLNWIGTKVSGVNTYYFPNKYKITATSPVSEYSMVLRLAEQYLIRAEARAQLNRVTGVNSAESDVNVIRKRAGLSAVTANTKSRMLLAIETERRFELFSEWGHRWLDLKRTNRADAVLAPVKGSNWQTTDQLYPIPQNEINKNPSLTGAQNLGY